MRALTIVLESWYFYGALAWVAAIQLLWMILFTAFAMRSTSDVANPAGEERWLPFRRAIRAWKLPTASVSRLFPSAPPDFHQRATETFKQQKADAVTVGGLGLAAWSILAALKPGMAQMPTRLLFLGVLVNLVGATLFRQGPSEKSYFGLEAFLIVGFFAIVLALLAFVPEVFHTGWLVRDILQSLAVAGALLETARAIRNIQRHHRMFLKPSS